MLVWRMSLQRDWRISNRSGACPNPLLPVRFEDDDGLVSVRAKDRAESVEWMREPTVVGWTVLQLGPAFLLFWALASTSISAGLRWKLCRKCSTSFRSRNQSPSTVAEVRVGHHVSTLKSFLRVRQLPFCSKACAGGCRCTGRCDRQTGGGRRHRGGTGRGRTFRGRISRRGG